MTHAPQAREPAWTGKRIMVLDNFLTWEPSTEAPRNMLLAAGASEVIAAGVGEYGPTFWVSTAPDEPWDPFGPLSARCRAVRRGQPSWHHEFVGSRGVPRFVSRDAERNLVRRL